MRTHHALRRAVRRRLDAVHGDSGVGRRARADGPGGPGGGGTRARGGARGRALDDRGMSAIEFVFLTPLFFMIVFVTVQFAMYYFADHIAVAAARAGARKGAEQEQVSSDWQDQARAKADWYIHQLGGGMLDSPSAVPTVDGNVVTMTVTGSVPSVVPWLGLHVTAVSTSPVERFVPDGAP